MTGQNMHLPKSRPHPGIILSEKLEEMGVSSGEFAARIGEPEETINAVLDGKRSAITAELAVQFERATRISAHFWLKSQRKHDWYMERKDYVPMASPDFSKRYTYADCLSWPEGYRCEIINGVAKELPSVYPAQAAVSGKLMSILYSRIENCGCKFDIYGSIDVRLPKNGEVAYHKIDTVVQPDICVICDLSKIDEFGCCGAPDMIVEVLSPSTLKNDCIRKFLLYEEHGVREYWMVHPNDKAITVFLLQENGRYGDGNLYEFEGKAPVRVLNI